MPEVTPIATASANASATAEAATAIDARPVRLSELSHGGG
jgi:hypothetical protein